MIFKQADSKVKDIEILLQLLQRSDLTQQMRQHIEHHLQLVRSGIKGEAESAYQLQFHFGNHSEWVIINDLRLKYQGKVAQIDHLLINRHMQIFVCESKRIAGSLIINEQGMASPLEQNRRHITLLNNLLLSDKIQLPSRFGRKLRPPLYSLILVSNDACIRRSRNPVSGLDSVIKNEQLQTKVQQLSKPAGILNFIHTIPIASIQKFARQLVQLH